MTNILHLTSWFPSKEALHEVPFVKAHVEAMQTLGGQHTIVHVEARNTRGRLRAAASFDASSHAHMTLDGVRGPARVREWLTVLLLLIVRCRFAFMRWHVVVVHIAWPLLRYPRLFRALFGQRVLLVEHWSAYASNFHLNPASRAHGRMRAMFVPSMPIAVVSRQLAKDIAAFCQRDDLDIHVVPNVVDARFKFRSAAHRQTLFMAANWNDFRLPFHVLHALPVMMQQYPELILVIAGEGPQAADMRAYVAKQVWAHRVEFLGFVLKDRIAEEMHRARVFAHPTRYETFSVITAEALTCGVPVVASRVGALPEVVASGEDGLLIENTDEAWLQALQQAWEASDSCSRQARAERAWQRYSPEAVGKQFQHIINNMLSKQEVS